MNHFRFIAPCVVILSTSVCAQQTPPATSPGKTTKAPAPKEIDPEILQRRSIAMSLLQSLAIEARSYRDEPLRARVQARVADALWDQDKETARSLFRRAWEVAEVVETDAPSPGNSAPGRLAQGQPARPRTNLRREILQLAARRDHTLGEEFLAKMTAKDEAQRTSDSTINRQELSAAEAAERIRLASGFLASDNIERALQFADPALTRATMGSIGFLTMLRDKNPAAADQRFAALLSIAAADPKSDANTVSLLTSYAFTPSSYLLVSSNGIPSGNTSVPRAAAPDLPSALRQSFFQTAANILLRPFAQLDQSSAGRAGTYFIATRLFPLFQQFAADLAPAISAQLAALGPEAGRATAQAGDSSINRWMNNDGRRSEIDDELKDLLDRAQGSDARDRAYAFAAMRAAEEGDPRARDFVDKIEDLDTRTGLRTFVEYRFIGTLLTKKRADEALMRIRKADLPHTLRAHFITQAAALLPSTDHGRAIELLDEALAETRRIDASTPDRAYCLVALLAQFSKLDKARAWELISETVKAANTVADFTGENGNSQQILAGKFSIRMGTELASTTDLRDTFVSLAEDNFYQAVDAGKTFSGDAPRALVTISVARAVLETKPAKPSQRNK
jgi:hypothetical protein